MSTTYVITPADATTNRMTATAYPSREAAAAAASSSDYVVEGPSDILWTGRTMVDVFNALTGTSLKKFENLGDGRRRLMEALPVIAGPSQPTTQEHTVNKEEREAARQAKQQEREAAKQEKANAKQAKQQEREDAKQARAASQQNGTRQRFKDDARIKLLVTENPKKHGAAATRFPLYRDGMTVEQALEAGILRADLSWDTKKKFIAIES